MHKAYPLTVAVGDLEDTVRNTETDLQQQRSLVEQLDVDKVRMQVEQCIKLRTSFTSNQGSLTD